MTKFHIVERAKILYWDWKIERCTQSCSFQMLLITSWKRGPLCHKSHGESGQNGQEGGRSAYKYELTGIGSSVRPAVRRPQEKLGPAIARPQRDD